MFSNKSNRNLGIVSVVLIIIVIIMFTTDNKNERTFRENLIDIDTSKVSEISINSKAHGEVKLSKKNDLWQVKLNSGKSVSVPGNKITSLFGQLLEIKPKRLAARVESKWKDFQVDSAGTRVIVKEGGSTALDLIIGRFAFQQPRTMNTYVRLTNDVDVYEVEGFLQATFNQDANSFRDGRILVGVPNYEDWKNIDFNYPADSSFQLIKVNDLWRTIKHSTLDSSKTVQYLRQLSSLSASKFIDDEMNLSNPLYSMNIDMQSGEKIQINGYKNDDKIIISSSVNTEALFDGSENDLWKKLFISETSLVPKK